MSDSSFLSLFSAAVRDLPRFSSLAETILSQAEELISLIPSLLTAFSVDTAEGIQLDLLGEPFGLPRAAAADPSDETYRACLKAKLILWRWDGTNETVPALLEEAFPEQAVTLTDNGNMTVTGRNVDDLPGESAAMLPIPVGVGLYPT